MIIWENIIMPSSAFSISEKFFANLTYGGKPYKYMTSFTYVLKQCVSRKKAVTMQNNNQHWSNCGLKCSTENKYLK